MKSEFFSDAMTYIDDDLIEAADVKKSVMNTNNWIRWGSIAAAVCAVTILSVGMIGVLSRSDQPFHGTVPITQSGTDTADPAGTKSPSDGGEENPAGQKGDETAWYEKYQYRVDEGEFASYTPGKVIRADLVGTECGKVTVTGGWVRPEGAEQAPAEHLSGTVYEIHDIPKETAVCIRFSEQGEALLTDCYYVLINMEGDTEAVSSYIIQDIFDQGELDGMMEE